MTRVLADQSSQASPAATYPGMALPVGAIPSQHRFNEAVKTILESGTGQRGRFDKWVTLRDMDERLRQLGIAVPGLNLEPPSALPDSGAAIPIVGLGGTQFLSISAFADKIRSTKLYTDLTRRIDDPARFDDLPQRTRELLAQDLATEAQKIGADIRRLDEKVQNDRESFAQTMTQITAAVAGSAAGVRQVEFAFAGLNRAVAGSVTTITARLNNFGGGGSTVEVVSQAIADRATGLEARYTVKVTAGGAMAGFGLAAYDNTAGSASSAFIIQADKFAIVDSSYAGGLDTTPDVANIPFGVDGDGVYVGGNLKVSGLAYIDGNQTVDTYNNALAVNSSLARPVGGYFKTNTNIAEGGVAGVFYSSNGGTGVHGTTVGGASGYGGRFVALTAGHIALRAEAIVGATSINAAGPMTIDSQITSTLASGTKPLNVTSTTVCTNLNADTVDGYHAGNSNGNVAVANGTVVTNLNTQFFQGYVPSDFATSGHNHSGTYETVANVAKAMCYQTAAGGKTATGNFALLTSVDGSTSGWVALYA